jgi:hypothetical protein
MLATVAADPRWWKFYFQRLFLRPQTRMAWARRLGRFRPEAPSAMGNPLSIELRASGFASLGSVLDLRQCKEIEEFLRSRKVHDPYRKEMAGLLPFDGRRDPKAHVLYHFPEDVLCSPHLLGLANCPDILEAAAGFLGCKPSIGYMTAWWSFPTGLGAQHAEQFHRDVDDWRFVKLFVYLTPVTSASGPHVYVKGSALSERLLEIRRYEDEEVEREFPPANRMTLTGSAGDAFLEDTFGIHKGQPVVRGHRLIFQVVYSMFSLPYGPRRPVGSWAQHGQPSFDPWVNRVYLGSV